MDDTKEALERAAASPDPAVRNMALRYREIQQEFGQYEAFFTIYKLGVKMNGTPVVPARERTVAPPRPAAPRNRVDVIGTAIRDILIQFGHPMKLAELHETYQQAHSDDLTLSETFRQRLVKRPSVFASLGSGRWWLVNVPVPEMAESVQ